MTVGSGVDELQAVAVGVSLAGTMVGVNVSVGRVVGVGDGMRIRSLSDNTSSGMCHDGLLMQESTSKRLSRRGVASS